MRLTKAIETARRKRRHIRAIRATLDRVPEGDPFAGAFALRERLAQEPTA